MDNNIRESDSFRMTARETRDILLRAPFRMQGCFHERDFFIIYFRGRRAGFLFAQIYMWPCIHGIAYSRSRKKESAAAEMKSVRGER